MQLTETQIERYSRQILLSEIGGEGQEKLFTSKVLIVGTGGLGTPAALYLAAAGVGKLGLVDYDKTELNNLQRQILYRQSDVGTSKVAAAQKHLAALNEEVSMALYPLRLDKKNALEIIREYDIVVDGSDNFETKYLLNDTCITAKIPLSHAGILKWDGQLMTILPGQSPCLRCLFPESPELGAATCRDAGIIGAVAGVIGSLQAAEVLKYLLGKGELLAGKLLVYNGLDSFFRHVKIPQRAGCVCIGS